jgi:uncharacterized protein (TIGR02217 family)
MNFHEVRLPARLVFGSTGGVERRTEVVTLASGHERRSTPWMHGRRRWLIGGGIRSLEDLAELTAFFEARRGRLYGFRFRDFADWKAAGEPIGVSDGARTTFQLSKRYGDYRREISKPVVGTVAVSVAGAVAAFEVDAATGLVTLGAAPAAGAAVTASFEFDVPVRFDSDRMDVTLESFEAGRVVAAPLVEVRI